MGTRRAFIGALCGTVGAVSLEPLRAGQGAERRGESRMSLSLAAYSFRRYLTDYQNRGAEGTRGAMTLEEFVDLCAEYGLAGTEVTSYYIPEPLPIGYLQRLRRHVFMAGLTVSGTAIGNTFTYPPGPQRDREIAYTKLWIDRAAEMGAPTIRIFAGELQPGTAEAEAREWCIDAIRDCCEVAQKRGVLLVLENHFGIVSDVEQTIALVREVDSEWLGVNWDSGNFHSADPYGDLARLAPYAFTAQVKTTMRPRGRPEPADLARVVGILKDANYRGWLALEYVDSEDPKVAVPRYLEELRRLTEPRA